MIIESLRSGHKRPLLAAPCSYGKTYLAADIAKGAQEKGKRLMFICDRIKLVQQTEAHFYGLDYGVYQGDHIMYNPAAPVQIASIKTIQNLARMPVFDIAIVDECHVVYSYVKQLMEAYNNVPFIGMSATPFSKGLGQHYDDLLIPTTPRELEADGLLCPTTYYGGERVDTSKMRTKRLPTGGTDFHPDDLKAAWDDDAVRLVGGITKNWYAHAEGMMSIAFCPSIKASKWLVDEFNGNGVAALHLDGYTKKEARDEAFQAHRDGEVKLISCSQLLNTGYDEPAVQCLIDCYNTKSIIAYVQRVGRIKRTFDGKTNSVYLDHAGNFDRFGFAEDIVPETLHDGEKRYNERNLVKAKDKEAKSKCPACGQNMSGIRCSCGYEIPTTQQMETDESTLVELKSSDSAANKRNKLDSRDEKSRFYGEVMLHCAESGKKMGWASHKYRERYGVWPNKTTPMPVDFIRPETKSWIQAMNIRYSRGRARA